MKPDRQASTAQKISRPVMRYHGGKFLLAEWIMEFFPDHDTYVEPFGGAASVLMRKPRSRAEVYNDLDDEVVNVFRVLRNPEQARRLKDLCALTPYARSEFETAYEPSADPVEQARRTIFRAGAGFGSAGATGSTGFRSYSKTNRGVTPAADWASYPDAITAFCDRLRGVTIESGNAVDIIDRHDAPGTLFFVDPPYMHETRIMAGNPAYRHEMTERDHRALLNRLVRVDGFVTLSGYPTEIYKEILIPTGWKRFSRAARASGKRGTSMRMECVWINPRCADGLRQRSLFEELIT
jgi:DNA adenine methylase